MSTKFSNFFFIHWQLHHFKFLLSSLISKADIETYDGFSYYWPIPIYHPIPILYRSYPCIGYLYKTWNIGVYCLLISAEMKKPKGLLSLCPMCILHPYIVQFIYKKEKFQSCIWLVPYYFQICIKLALIQFLF